MRIQSKDLLKLWDAPEHGRLTAKQISLRLPVGIAARVAALCELYPNKNRTQVISDLLSTAFSDLEEGFPAEKGSVLYETTVGEVLYEDVGIRRRYYELVHDFICVLEREAGREEPTVADRPIVLEDGTADVISDSVSKIPELREARLKEGQGRLDELEKRERVTQEKNKK